MTSTDDRVVAMFCEPSSTDDRLALLALAGERLGTSLDLHTTLQNLARLLVPAVADFCVIDLLEDDGRLHRAEAAHVDPKKEAMLRETDGCSWIAENGPQLITNGEPLLTDVNESPPTARTNTSLAHVTLGAISSISAPLVASGRTLGVLTLATAESGRRYGPADLAIVQDLTRRASLAIVNARLHRAEQRAREAAERAAERTMRLQALTSNLAVAVTPTQVAEAALRQGMSAVDARAAAIAVRTRDGSLTVVLAMGFAKGSLERAMRLDLAGSRPLALSFMRGEPLWIESGAAMAEASPPLELEQLEAGAPGAIASMPMTVEDKPTGAIAFYFREPRAFSVEDKSFLSTLARQTTLAIERARLYETTERARISSQISTTRLAALQRMTEALSGAVSRVKVAEIIVDHAREMLPECKAIVATLSEDGQQLDCVRAIGHTQDTLDRYDTMELAFPSPLTDAVRTKTPVFFDTKEAFHERYPHLAGPPGATEANLVAAVPFVVEDRALGGLLLRLFQPNRQFAEDQAFILHLARTCTQSLERARLYEAERAARAELEAERSRLELLAETSAVINASLDMSTVSESIARVTVPRFASYCIVCSLDDEGAPRFMAAVHEDPTKEVLLREMRERYAFGPNHQITEVARTRKSKLTPHIDDAGYRAISADEQQLEMIRRLHTTSSLVVPLIARGHALGVLSFGLVHGHEREHFTQKDLALAEELAQRTALALDNARLYNEAQEASRVKDEFLGVVSHELRTPLNAILGWARMLRTGAVREGHQPRALEAIERNATHQARLIDDLLDASRVTAGKLRLDASVIELVPVVENAVHTVTPGANAKDLRIVTSLESGPIQVLGDASRLQQIVWNLLSNAIKFTPRGGQIEVRLSRKGDEAEIIVVDNGRGIRAELLPHVFERFRQGDGTLTRHSGGLGLGLSIVRHLVEAHGGTVRAESPGPDRGAVFTVKLPIAKPPPQPIAPVREKPPEARSLAGLSVLVVDDEPDAREILEAVLSIEGANVKTAADAAEALNILADFTPDVLVSDLAMPGEDGLSLIRKIRSRTPNRVATIPAIALTAYTRPEDRVRALNAGFQMHVPKPVDPTELVVTIASLRQLLH